MVSLRLCFEPLFLDICNIKQILTMIARIKSFQNLIWFALISTRGMTLDKLLLPRSSSLLHHKQFGGGGGLWFQLSHILIFESSHVSEVSTDLQDFGL